MLISITLRDIYGRTTTKRFESVSTTVSAAQADATAILGALEDVSDLGQVKVEMTFVATIATPVGPVALSNVDTGATLHTTLVSNKGYALKIPGIKSGMIGPDGRIDIDAEEMVAYVALFEGAAHFRVSDGDQISSVQYGELDK